MANLLESLTNHYDRCSDALKSAESGHPLDPDLYDILSRDAGEVPDVVRELKERLQEMEQVAGSGITASIRELNVTQHQLLALFHAFEEFSTELAACMVSLREFESRQEELKTTMSERLEELWGLGDFYEGFFGAYDAMVVEVGRRRGVQKRMELVMRDAVEKLGALHEEDLNDREQFRDDWGQWLPVDIWPGIGDPPVRYRVEKDLQGGRELPGLPREVVEKAYIRRKEKGIAG
jgi:autophagy-related protein 17